MKHFTISELIHSDTAVKRRIWNGATREVEDNLIALVGAVLDPVRERWGKPIAVTSGYRSAELNRIVGGVATSQHLKGEAADICAANPKETARLGRLIVQMGSYDQVIFEYSNADCTEAEWIHVSWKRVGTNRRQILRLLKGSKRYEQISI
ncbi:MAG: peptidase M15 [Bacteroidales bacterium]|nr:peptidase M15 [Bacteroidales bacterium]